MPTMATATITQCVGCQAPVRPNKIRCDKCRSVNLGRLLDHCLVNRVDPSVMPPLLPPREIPETSSHDLHLHRPRRRCCQPDVYLTVASRLPRDLWRND